LRRNPWEVSELAAKKQVAAGAWFGYEPGCSVFEVQAIANVHLGMIFRRGFQAREGAPVMVGSAQTHAVWRPAFRPAGDMVQGRHRTPGPAGANPASRTAKGGTGRGSMGSRFFFEGRRDVAIGAQADHAVLDIGDQGDGDDVMMPFVAALRAVDLGAGILLGQLDAISLDLVDGADMDAIAADDLGRFLNLADIDDFGFPSLKVRTQRTIPEFAA
jgi:hypothetical protein